MLHGAHVETSIVVHSRFLPEVQNREDMAQSELRKEYALVRISAVYKVIVQFCESLQSSSEAQHPISG